MTRTRTEPPLEQLKLSQTARSLEWFHFLLEHDELDLAPDYQRGSVWTPQQRRDLIRSILLGLPIGAIIINARDTDTADNLRRYGNDYGFAVVDGKQRIEAIEAFLNDELEVPADWFEDRALGPDVGGTVTYSQLSRPGQRFFRNTPIGVVEANLETLADEAAVFGLVNSTGVAQRPDDLDRARRIAG